MKIIELGERVQDRDKTIAIIINDTDNIAYDTAGLLASKVVNIQELTDIDKCFEHIIICGHGNHKRLTIGKMSIDEIVATIANSGYNFQDIYVTSCFSNVVYEGNTRTIVEDLRDKLSYIMRDNVSISSDADGATITYTEYGKVRMLIITNRIQIGFLVDYEDKLKNRIRKKRHSEIISIADIEKIRRKMVRVATMGGLLVK